MADSKISALPAASTPLAGTEVLPIVQSGATDQVTVANLTAGRAVSALSFAGALNGTVGATTANTGAFTTVSATGAVSALSFAGALNGTVGATTANTGAFTTVSATGAVSALTLASTTGAAFATTSGNVGVGITDSLAGSYSMKLGVSSVIGIVPATQNTVGSIVSLRSQLGSGGGESFLTNQITSYVNAANYDTAVAFSTRAGSTTSEKIRINATGTLSIYQATTAAAPAYVKGAMYFDTTLNKLRIGGATAWETVTSA